MNDSARQKERLRYLYGGWDESRLRPMRMALEYNLFATRKEKEGEEGRKGQDGGDPGPVG